jgi:hypothetical protein
MFQIAGALAGGVLFGLSATYAFLAITAVCLLGAGTVLVPWAAQESRLTGSP